MDASNDGLLPWYDDKGKAKDVYVIGVAGGSASGKTSVAQAILKDLANSTWMGIISQDSFYKHLDHDQQLLAFNNKYNFDHPNAFDFDLLSDCIAGLKSSKAVRIPRYSFATHQREEQEDHVYGLRVIVLEGLFVLHDCRLRELLDLKVFVQADSDLMLARRIQRDIKERGRDVSGVLQQYLDFVKPSMDAFVMPSSKHANIIIPGERNEVAIEMIRQHVRIQMDHGNNGTEVSHLLPINSGSEKAHTAKKEGDHAAARTAVDDAHHDTRAPLFTDALELLCKRGGDEGITDYCVVSLESCIDLEGEDPRLRAMLSDTGWMNIRKTPSGGIQLCSLHLPLLLEQEQRARACRILLISTAADCGASLFMAIRVLVDHGVQEKNISYSGIHPLSNESLATITSVFRSVRLVAAGGS